MSIARSDFNAEKEPAPRQEKKEILTKYTRIKLAISAFEISV